MKKLIVILLVLCLILPGCKSKESSVISMEEAQEIVLDSLRVDADQVTFHVHIGSGEVPSYVIYATVGGHTLEYIIRATDGEILSMAESDHSH